MGSEADGNCAGIKRLVDSFVTGEIAQGDRHAVEDHLELCGSCRRYWRSRRDIWHGLLSLRLARPTPELVRKTTDAVAIARARPIPLFSRPLPKVLAAAASLALAFGLGFATSTLYLDSGSSTASPQAVANASAQPRQAQPVALPPVWVGFEPDEYDRGLIPLPMVEPSPADDVVNASYNQ